MAQTRYRYVECRAIGHSWEQIEDDRSHKSFGVAMQFRCDRCTTVRRDVVSTVSGELLYRSYSKPDDYKLGYDEVGGYFDRNDWRLALINQRKRSRRRQQKPQLTVVPEVG